LLHLPDLPGDSQREKNREHGTLKGNEICCGMRTIRKAVALGFQGFTLRSLAEYSTVPEVLAHGPCGPTVFNQSQLTLRFLREVIG
jgi:hypothetical protein